MEKVWFEENLYASFDELGGEVKNLIEKDEDSTKFLQVEPQGVVRISNPKWQSLGGFNINSNLVQLWKVRLRFQFAPTNETTKFLSTKCECYIAGDQKMSDQPCVFDFYPKEINDGEAKNIGLKFEPKISVFNLEASLGEISSNIDVGQVIPIVIGYPGINDRTPYWEMRPGKHPIQGTRDFWLVLEQPKTCNEIQLRVRVEGIIQSFWGPIPVSSRNRLWENRPLFKLK